jgi:hypothetical protein
MFTDVSVSISVSSGSRNGRICVDFVEINDSFRKNFSAVAETKRLLLVEYRFTKVGITVFGTAFVRLFERGLDAVSVR